MEDYTKYWVMIPIGNEEEHKQEFVDDFLSIFPNNSVEKIERQWEVFNKIGIIHVVYDVRVGKVVFSKTVNGFGTQWEISSHLIKNISYVKNFKMPNKEELENTNSDGNMTDDGKPAVDKSSTNTSKYELDDLLKIISLKGYDNLSDEQKEFLKTMRK